MWGEWWFLIFVVYNCCFVFKVICRLKTFEKHYIINKYYYQKYFIFLSHLHGLSPWKWRRYYVIVDLHLAVIVRGDGETSWEEGWQMLCSSRKQETRLLHWWHEHGRCRRLWNLSATRSHSPTSGLQALVIHPSHLFELKEILVVGLPYNTVFSIVCRYDSQKLTMKEIHNSHYITCMNPTSGSFTINPRLQVFIFLL